MAWRSNPLIFSGFYTQNQPLTWEEHKDWWRNRNKDWQIFIIMIQEDTHFRDVGVVTIGQLDNWNPEIGYFIGEISLWGKGIGKRAVKLTLDWLRKQGYEYCHTTVLANNFRSINLLKSLGFNYVCPARVNEERWEKQL